MPRVRPPADRVTTTIRPSNPFDLIRLLARSQNDPKKALAELVQNALDAGARTVTVERGRERRRTCLKVRDDGAGVLPDRDRKEALRYLATHVGESLKRRLSPAERREQLVLGTYGIGILGFWSLGGILEMRTRVAGGEPWVLRLFEDDPKVEMEPWRGGLFEGETWTEVVVLDLHPTVQTRLSGRRVADYLAMELRGQIQERGVDLRVHDRLARGRAQREIRVIPPRFRGDPIAVATVRAGPFGPVRFDLHDVEAGAAEEAVVAITAGGAVVYDRVADFPDLAHPPWTLGRLSGTIEFADFEVAPGTRRGVAPDERAAAFHAAVLSVERSILEAIEARDVERAVAEERDLAKDLRRVFRDLVRAIPHLELFPVMPETPGGTEPADPVGLPVAAPTEPDGEGDDGAEEDLPLFPPGPLAAVRVTPAAARVVVGSPRRFHAAAFDAGGRRLDGDVVYVWSADGVGAIEAGYGRHATFRAGPAPGPARVSAVAALHGASATGEARVDVVADEGGDGRGDAGIPEPVLVDEPHAGWRSRYVDGRWEVNRRHPDYLRSACERRRLLRYLAMLFAKELALRDSGDPRHADVLERMAQILALVDPHLR
ncbi:MAG: ATP-binding protein [Planctomycetes bacterium]|nr:ATP-binding protein [Planctomycetota bacterium]